MSENTREESNKITSLYTDGGLLSPNPSNLGGTWAWCAVDINNKRIIGRGGYILAKSIPITNNQMEQIAILLALEAMPDDWSGTVHTDSSVARGRIFNKRSSINLPETANTRIQIALSRLGHIKSKLIQGHPTKTDLIKGYGKKRGLPVSVHNVWADHECNRQKVLALDFLAKERMKNAELARA